jgi:Domain of unknown function (DUF5658)
MADAPPAAIGAARKYKPRPCRSETETCWRLLLVLFAALQIADVLSTNHALTIPGAWEANPLMALSQARLGAAWWLPKMAVAGLVCFAAPLLRKRWPMIFLVSYYGVVVSINIAQF